MGEERWPKKKMIAFKRQVLQIMRVSIGDEYEDLKNQLRDIERCSCKSVPCVEETGEIHDSAHMFKLLVRLGSRKFQSQGDHCPCCVEKMAPSPN